MRDYDREQTKPSLGTNGNLEDPCRHLKEKVSTLLERQDREELKMKNRIYKRFIEESLPAQNSRRLFLHGARSSRQNQRS